MKRFAKLLLALPLAIAACSSYTSNLCLADEIGFTTSPLAKYSEGGAAFKTDGRVGISNRDIPFSIFVLSGPIKISYLTYDEIGSRKDYISTMDSCADDINKTCETISNTFSEVYAKNKAFLIGYNFERPIDTWNVYINGNVGLFQSTIDKLLIIVTPSEDGNDYTSINTRGTPREQFNPGYTVAAGVKKIFGDRVILGGEIHLINASIEYDFGGDKFSNGNISGVLFSFISAIKF